MIKLIVENDDVFFSNIQTFFQFINYSFAFTKKKFRIQNLKIKQIFLNSNNLIMNQIYKIKNDVKNQIIKIKNNVKNQISNVQININKIFEFIKSMQKIANVRYENFIIEMINVKMKFNNNKIRRLH